MVFSRLRRKGVSGMSVMIAGVCLACLTGGCGDGSKHTAGDGQPADTLTCRAELLTLIDYGDYQIAEVKNPWGDGLLGRYVLVAKDYTGDLPEGTTVVRVPLERSIVYSGVHAGIIDELGRLDAIRGVADGKYFSSAKIQNGLKLGEIRDVGNSSSPSVEEVVDIDPDAIVLSPYQNQEIGAVDKLGVPVVQMADYMERMPLGRAEWIKLIGRLYGQAREADSIYSAVVAEYEGLRDDAAQMPEHPVVITEMPQPGGAWDIPSGESYMARILADAGGVYPWASTRGGGSLKMDAAAMLDKGGEADYWLIRSFGRLTLQDLGQSSPLAQHFKAFRMGQVYVSDTSTSSLYDEFPFHPERLLREYVAIFHPSRDGSGEGGLRYFRRISE